MSKFRPGFPRRCVPARGFFVFSSYFWPPSQPIKDLRVLVRQEHHGEARPPHSHAGRRSSRLRFLKTEIEYSPPPAHVAGIHVTGAQGLHVDDHLEDECLPIRRDRVRVPHDGQNSAIPSSGRPHGLSAAAERRSFHLNVSIEEAESGSRTEPLARIKSV